MSSSTIQKILQCNGTRYERWLKLEEKVQGEGAQLTPEQIAWLERQTRCFREWHVESSRLGELLCQDTFYVGILKGVGKAYLQAMVATYSSFVFGYLHTRCGSRNMPRCYCTMRCCPCTRHEDLWAPLVPCVAAAARETCPALRFSSQLLAEALSLLA